ncbi:2-dehydropantoate 2-reductase [bacterium]|nr:2-dehydropantoate 2-reductase [bacterium]
MKHVGIVGAGSIGCFVGAHLARAGVAVSLLGRERLKVAVAQHGLRITDFNGSDWTLPADAVTVTTSAADLARCDVLIVCTKSNDTATAAQELAPVIGQDCVVISLQNGVRNPHILREHLPNHTVLAAMVPYNVVWDAPAHFHNGTSGQLEFQAGAEQVVAALQAAGLAAAVAPDIVGVQWGKLVINLNNATNALSGLPLKAQLADRDLRRVTAAAQREALSLLKQAGVSVQRSGRLLPKLTPHVLRLPTWLFQRVAAQMVKIDPQARSSMWDDLNRGRATEVDYLNGEVVRLAKTNQLEAPINTEICKLIHAAEQADGAPSYSGQVLRSKLAI